MVVLSRFDVIQVGDTLECARRGTENWERVGPIVDRRSINFARDMVDGGTSCHIYRVVRPDVQILKLRRREGSNGAGLTTNELMRLLRASNNNMIYVVNLEGVQGVLMSVEREDGSGNCFNLYVRERFTGARLEWFVRLID